MSSNNIDNLTIHPTAVVEAELAPLPDLPDALLNIDGVSDWWEEMKLNRERDKETLYRMLLTRSGSGAATTRRGGGSGISRNTAITAISESKLNISSTNITNVITGEATVKDDDDEQLFLSWLGL